MLCGCGGGFDFVHAMLIYPELRRLGKRVIIGSYSFGDPSLISGAQPLFCEAEAVAYQVTPSNSADSDYGPEVHLSSFLAQREPLSDTPIFAYYARSFTVARLTRFYQQLVERFEVDAIVLVDGGSDSLMVGDEYGLGDPIEDAVSISAVANLKNVAEKVLICVGLGTDRFNSISDASSLRAIAELTKCGAYLGAVGIEPDSEGALFYRECIEHIFERQRFRSVLAGTIDAAIRGWYGYEDVPVELRDRVRSGELFFWPIMSILWGFDVVSVKQRSLICGWIEQSESLEAQQRDFRAGRAALGDKRRGVENFPTLHDILNRKRNVSG